MNEYVDTIVYLNVFYIELLVSWCENNVLSLSVVCCVVLKKLDGLPGCEVNYPKQKRINCIILNEVGYLLYVDTYYIIANYSCDNTMQRTMRQRLIVYIISQRHDY
jgi:hypothetical protein